MVNCVASGTVDDGRVVGILAVMDQDCPDVDEDEEGDVGELGEREDEGEDVVGEALCISICGVEGVRGEGSRHDPLVVWLVDVFVDLGVMEAAVDPVDAEIGEADEEGELRIVVPAARAILCGIINLGVAADFEEEPGDGEDGHDGEGNVGLLHLEPNLVLEVLGVVESGLVEDEEVRKACEDEVDEDAEEPAIGLVGVGYGSVRGRCIPGDEVESGDLTLPVIARPSAHVGILRGLDGEVLRRGLVLPSGVRACIARGLFLEARKRGIACQSSRGGGQDESVQRVEYKSVCDLEDDVHVGGGGGRKLQVFGGQAHSGCDSRRVRSCRRKQAAQLQTDRRKLAEESRHATQQREPS